MKDKKQQKQKSFFRDVHEVVRLVPHGRVTTYGAISDYLGTVSARMVGWAMNKSTSAEFAVPAHRVVNRKGMLTGKNQFPNPTMMQELLESEGITIKQDRVVDFKMLFWNPATELDGDESD